MEIINVYEEVGSYRATAALCGTTHKTVKRIVEARTAPDTVAAAKRPSNTACVRDLVWDKIRTTDGRISAKRLLPLARAAGYEGSARNLRRLVAELKDDWRRKRRVFRPWVPKPGEHAVIDWGTHGRWHIFCVVLPWSRYRFVRFATDQTRVTTLRLLAEFFEEIRGVPQIVLSDRMACLKASVVCGVAVPHPDYVRFATHFGFRPDFCEAADPESKGVVESLVGYAKSDLVVPAGDWANLEQANAAARSWCAEVNGCVHSEIAAVPAQRLTKEREILRALPQLRPPLRRGELRKVDRLSTVRFGSARYSVPRTFIGRKVEVIAEERSIVIASGEDEICRHPLVAPGEVSIIDDHYGGARKAPNRAARATTSVERSFLELGDVAEAFLRAAAAAGTQRLATELRDIVELERSWGRPALVAALERATTFRRFKADDVRSILAAGSAVRSVVGAGTDLDVVAAQVPVRPLDAYALGAIR